MTDQLYYRRDGTPYGDALEWARDFETASRRVAHTVLADQTVVSTTWLGLDHGFGGPPLIFETMVFPWWGNWSDLDCARYSTEAEALEGHRLMVEKWTRPWWRAIPRLYFLPVLQFIDYLQTRRRNWRIKRWTSKHAAHRNQ